MAKEPPTQNDDTPQPYTLADVRALARVLKQYDLSSLEVCRGDERVILTRTPPASLAPATVAAVSAAPAPAAPPAEPAKPAEEPGKVITSPFVGTFYRAPSPDSPPFVEEGQTVQKGQVLCIVEAMKLMNEIEAEEPCKVLALLVNNGDPVEFGQALFRVKPLG